MERLEEMIRAAQLEELTMIKQEIAIMKNFNPQPGQVPVPYWGSLTPSHYQPTMYNQLPQQILPQYHYQQTQPGSFQPNGQSTLDKIGQQQVRTLSEHYRL